METKAKFTSKDVFAIRIASPEYKGLQEVKALKDANKFWRQLNGQKLYLKNFQIIWLLNVLMLGVYMRF